MFLWCGQTVSIIGDNFFNLAVMWVVYAQSGSALQTSLVQVVWHLDRIIFSPIAGITADRRDRKHIMVVANVVSAVAASTVAAAMFTRGAVPSAAILAAVFVLNSLNTFSVTARFSMMPEVVSRDLLTTASGLFSTVSNIAALVGSMLAGLIVAAVGAAWAVVGDGVSFVIAAVTFAMAPLPRHPAPSPRERPPAFLQELRDGWRVMVEEPVMRTLLWLGVLINVTSFLGPLYPALVSQRLHGNAAAYGLISAVSVVGGMAGGAVAGTLERRLGAGYLLVGGWCLAGISTLGVAASTSLPLTAALDAAIAFGFTVSGVASGALSQVLIPMEYRGRVGGISGSVSVAAIPLSTIIGGWFSDIVGVTFMFAVAGSWTLGVAILAWSNRHVREAHI